eukprot:GAHX01001713.1.p2 GENE.GAHX01001713.1~~GAHX01001713.1.p2  ORF type:complete len:77 (-),score=7.30 GAHX01001713.1:218-448(-)
MPMRYNKDTYSQMSSQNRRNHSLGKANNRNNSWDKAATRPPGHKCHIHPTSNHTDRECNAQRKGMDPIMVKTTTRT